MTFHFAKPFYLLAVLAGLFLSVASVAAQSSVSTDSVVPRLVNYSGAAKDESGKAMKGVIGATFAVYAGQEGGSPLWMETQNVNANGNGIFSVQLGATKPDGLPVDLFSAGQARWLGVSYNGGAEQPRIALLSVPYALKAGDAQTLDGLPASAFMLASSSPASNSVASANPDSVDAAGPPPAGAVTGSGTLDFLPLWTSTSAIGNSTLFQSGTGAGAKIGINTTAPGATLDVKGTTNLQGLLTLPAQGAATAAAGKASQAHDWVASSFSSTTSAPVNQTFQWKAEASGNNTATPSGTLNLLFGSGSTTPAETGFKMSSKGLLTFATGQTFPGAGTITGVTTPTGSGLTGGGTTGNLSLSLLKTCTANQTLQWNGTSWACATAGGTGTITGVTAGNDLTGGGTSGNVTLNLDTTKVPQLNSANTFNANQTISANGGNTALNVTQLAASGVTYAIIGTSRVPTNGDAAILGQQLANAEVFGVQGYISNSTGTGAGVFGSNAGPGATGSTYKGFASGVWGDAGTFGTIGVLATADNGNGVVAYNNSSVVSAVVGENLNTTNSSASLAPGVYGISSAPLGLGVIGSGPVHSSTFNDNVGFNPVGVVGDSSAAGGIGVWGVTDSGTSMYGSTNTGTGVYGLSSAGTGILGVSNTGIGVSGASTVSAGVAGSSPAAGNSGVYGLTTNTDLTNASYGVWGDDPTSNGTFAGANGGVYGYSQGGDGVTGVSAANSGIFNAAGFFLSTVNALPLAAIGARGSCLVDYAGNLACTGSKSAAVPLPDNRWVRLYAVESPENWFEDFGTGTLSNGNASIALEPTFRDTVTSSQDYHVFLTPRGECEGLYVASTSASGFEVRELHHGTSNIAFDYRIVVRRKGYENIRMQDVTEMQTHLASKREALQRSRRRPAGIQPAIVQPGSNRTRAELQFPVTLPANQAPHPNKPGQALPVPTSTAATKR
jgi:hypothetical protein